MIGGITVNKYLIKDGSTIYSIEGGERIVVGDAPVTAQMFEQYGVDAGDIQGSHFVGLSDGVKILLLKI